MPMRKDFKTGLELYEEKYVTLLRTLIKMWGKKVEIHIVILGRFRL